MPQWSKIIARSFTYPSPHPPPPLHAPSAKIRARGGFCTSQAKTISPSLKNQMRFHCAPQFPLFFLSSLHFRRCFFIFFASLVHFTYSIRRAARFSLYTHTQHFTTRVECTLYTLSGLFIPHIRGRARYRSPRGPLQAHTLHTWLCCRDTLSQSLVNFN